MTERETLKTILNLINRRIDCLQWGGSLDDAPKVVFNELVQLAEARNYVTYLITELNVKEYPHEYR